LIYFRLGNAFAVLSLDNEYQSSRLEAKQRETSARGLLAHSGKSLVGGVVEGISGLVLQPLRVRDIGTSLCLSSSFYFTNLIPISK
jgi:hypothetical protein